MKLIDVDLYLNDIKRVSDDKALNFSIFKNKKILITGASGLICSFLVDVLMYRNKTYNDNITIYMLCRNEKKILDRFKYYDLQKYDKDNDNCRLVYIIQDVCDPFDFDINFDYIIHGASNTHPRQYASDPIGTITTNVMGLNNILNYCINRMPKRIFMMSSVEIYGENKGDIHLFDENYLGYINCNTLRAGYPESKRLCESLCQAYISKYNMNIVIGRLSRTYGPTMLSDDSKALAQFIKNTVNNEDIVLKSEGNQFFSYLYVTDTVTAILKILFDGECGEAYNMSDSNSDIKLKDLATILAGIGNTKVVFEIPDDVEMKGYSTATKALLDSSKLKKIGWSPYYNIKDGLKNTINILKLID